MRITFVCPPPGLSGGIRVIAIYADRLAKRGHTVTIVHPPKPQPSLRDKLRSFVRGNGWPRVPLFQDSHFDELDVARLVLDRWRPVTAGDVPDADVVVATWWETAEWVAALPAQKGAKAYFIQHYETHSGQPVDRVEQTWRLDLHKIVVAQWLADIARTAYGDTDVSLVPNSVDIETFRAGERGKQPAPTVGYMYAIDRWKGSDIAAEAITKARKSAPDLHVVSFGMRNPVPDYPLAPETEFHLLPEQETIPQIYASCDAWLFASRTEGFGLPILEAMACRTPVIATPAGAAPELVGQGGGLLVAPEDSGAMADAIVAIARMPESEWRVLSDCAHSTATRYTWDHAADAFEHALVRASERTE
jgi:glycosyltransferase involved in cell wall biosynthesis